MTYRPSDAELLSLRANVAATILAVSYRDPTAYCPLDFVYRDHHFRRATDEDVAGGAALFRKCRNEWHSLDHGHQDKGSYVRDGKAYVLKTPLHDIAAEEAVSRADAIIRRCLQHGLRTEGGAA